MRRRDKQSKGFSLIEAAVAIGVIAILAAAAAPLVMKALNQQREAKTRENLKIAFEAMFGARDRRVANMRADFGFNPAGGLGNLGVMTNRLSAAAPVPPAYGLNAAAFNWGWNGPYWTGSTRPIGAAAAPIDAWGNAIQLRLVTGAFPGFQLISGGPNGQINSNNNNRTPLVDDIIFPEFPVVLVNSYSGFVYVNLVSNRLAATTGTVPIQYRQGGVLVSVTPIPAVSVPAGSAQKLGPYSIPSGPATITVNINSSAAVTGPPAIPAYSAYSFSQVIDLLPGETRMLSYTVN